MKMNIDKQQQDINELIHLLALDGYNQKDICLLIQTIRRWAFLKDGQRINDALCRGSVMIDHVQHFENQMKID